MQASLDHAANWLRQNILVVNASKSNVLLLGHPTKINNTHFVLQYNGSPITLCNSTKVLGLVIDKNLSWNDHIQLLLNKLSPKLGY